MRDHLLVVFAGSSSVTQIAVENFAPFFEVGKGVYLDKRVGIYWLLPLLFLTFLFNMTIHSKAFIDL